MAKMQEIQDEVTRLNVFVASRERDMLHSTIPAAVVRRTAFMAAGHPLVSTSHTDHRGRIFNFCGSAHA